MKAVKKFNESEGILKEITEFAMANMDRGIYTPDSGDDEDIYKMEDFLTRRGFLWQETHHEGKKALLIWW
jgi:hypothetical protein